MKKKLSFFAFVAIVISFAACGGKDGNVPGGEEPEVAKLQLKVQTLSHKAYFVITPPANNQQEFFFCWSKKSVVEEKGSVQDQVAYYLDDWLYTSLNSYKLIRTDKTEFSTADDYYLDGNTTYVLYACYIVKEGNKAKRVGDVVSVEFTTQPEYILNGEFTVNADGKKVQFYSSNMGKLPGSGGDYFSDNQWWYLGKRSTTDLHDYFKWTQMTDPNKAILPGDEWLYIFRGRNRAEELFAHATLSIDGNNIHGLILMPDNWQTPDGINLTTSYDMGFRWDESEAGYEKNDLDGFARNTFNKDQWATLEFAGAVFLPAPESLGGVANALGWYWGSTEHNTNYAHAFSFKKEEIYLKPLFRSGIEKSSSYSAIRPVRYVVQ